MDNINDFNSTPFAGTPVTEPAADTAAARAEMAADTEMAAGPEAAAGSAGYTAAGEAAAAGYSIGNGAPNTANGHEQQWSYSYQANHGGTAAGPRYEVPQPPTPPKKNKRHGAATALLLVLCLLLGCAGGYAGSWYANRTAQNAGTGISTSQQSTVGNNYTVANLTQTDGMTLTQLAAAVTPTVVQITTEYTVNNYWMQSSTSTGAGSGVIISTDGYIITNNHVISDALSIKVTLSTGEEYDAKLVATDSESDIAVVKIDASDLPSATVGDSDNLVVGQDVIAVGNPLGELGGTVTNGIISAVSRDVTVDSKTMSLIQTNTAINPGNSGGGLFDANGKLIGIVNAKYSDTNVEGLGFAIPINTAMKSAQDLISVGYVTGRSGIGVNLLDITDQQTAFQYRVDRLGVYVYSTTSGSAAEQAGLKTGDYVVSVDGTEVSSAEDVRTIFNNHSIGDTVTFHIIRTDKEMDIDVTLQELVPSSSNSNS